MWEYMQNLYEGVLLYSLVIRGILITVGLLLDLLGGLLLAFEMLELLEKIKSYNSTLSNNIKSIDSELIKIGIILMIADIFNGFKTKKVRLKDYLALYTLVMKFRLSYKLLLILEKLTNKFSTKRVFGLLGATSLIIGFIFQLIANFIPI